MNDLAGAASSMDLSAAACLARARSLIPVLQAAADRIEANNELPSNVLDAMHEARMFRLLLPRSLGGAELRPIDYIQCVEAIAQGDASTGWCMNQGGGCAMAAAYVAPAVAREVFGGPRDVLAWGQGPGAKAIRSDGGWLGAANTNASRLPSDDQARSVTTPFGNSVTIGRSPSIGPIRSTA